MPREVLGILDLSELGDAPSPKSRPRSKGKAPKGGDRGYIADSAVRSAIEWRAVNLAIGEYEDHGFEVDYTGASKPYDLVATKGRDVRRVEGSSGAATTVELTTGGRELARVHPNGSLRRGRDPVDFEERTAQCTQAVGMRAGGRTGLRRTPASPRRDTAMLSRPGGKPRK